MANAALVQAAEAAGIFKLPSTDWNQEQIRQLLGKIGGAEQEINRRRSLEQLAAAMPPAEISEALNLSSLVVNDQQRSHFQRGLLVRLGQADPVAAMTNASAVQQPIVNDDGQKTNCTYFQFAVLEQWMQTDLPGAFRWICQLSDTDFRQRALEKIMPALATDNPTNTLIRLNDLQPAPDERIYPLLFQSWAAHDPVQAIQHRHQIPSQDEYGQILCIIIKTWVNQQPDAAWDWVQSQLDSEAKYQALATCIRELVKIDSHRAWALAEAMPAGTCRKTVMAALWMKSNPFAALEWSYRLNFPSAIVRAEKTRWTEPLFPTN